MNKLKLYQPICTSQGRIAYLYEEGVVSLGAGLEDLPP